MEPFVVSLLKQDFNAMSNRGLIASALDRKIALRHFFEQTRIHHPILLKVETPYGVKGRYFNEIDFSKPRFIYAIEDYVIGGARQILTLAPERGIATAVNQIFGKGALEVIAEGEMALPDKKPRNGSARIDLGALAPPDTRETAFSNVITLPFGQLRRG